MDLVAIKAELDAGHPGPVGNPGIVPYDVDDAIAAGQFNAVNRTLNRTSMTGSEVLNAIDAAEWGTRTAEQKQVVWDIVHLGDINPFGVEVTLMTSAFTGAGGVTMAELNAARKDNVSRAVELGLGFIYPGHIEQARAQ